MSLWTLFLNPQHSAFKDDAYISAYSKDAVVMPAAGTKHNVLWRRVEEISLANLATRTVDVQNLVNATDTLGAWCCILVRVVGACTINTTAKDADGVTVITAKVPFYGTALYPDMGIITTYNVSAFVASSLADGTVIELFAGVLAADGDTRLTTYA